MYKVMVVDDEPWGRKSVSKMIDELALDVEVIAEARHGEEALELIRMSKPHIVVTDMDMPVMNGQRFLEELHAHYGEIKVIVISGYSQFEYMKAALTYQVCEYVLKPVSVTDLHQAMVKAIEASREYWSIQQQMKFNQDAWKLRRETFLQHVTAGRIANLSDIQHQAAELRIPALSGGYRFAVCAFRQFPEISATKFHGNADLLMFSVENILREILRDDEAIVYKSDDRTRICLILPEDDYEERRIGRLLADYHGAVNRMLRADAVVGLSRVYYRLDKLSEAFQTSNEELLHNRMNAVGLTISVSDVQASAASQDDILSGFEWKALKTALASGNGKDAVRLLNDFHGKVIRDSQGTIRQVHRALSRIAETAASEMKDAAISRPSLFDPGAISGIMDGQGLRYFLDRMAEAIAEHVDNHEEAESVHTVREIVSYLDSHYFEDLSLIDVATRYHLDPSYLSKRFKTVTHVNFTEYITRKRMEKACELLRSSDRKVNEISELVGYENQRYFSQVFRRFAGQTPSDYREAHGGGPNSKI